MSSRFLSLVSLTTFNALILVLIFFPLQLPGANYYLTNESRPLHRDNVMQVCRKSFISPPLEMVPRPSHEIVCSSFLIWIISHRVVQTISNFVMLQLLFKQASSHFFFFSSPRTWMWRIRCTQNWTPFKRCSSSQIIPSLTLILYCNSWNQIMMKFSLSESVLPGACAKPSQRGVEKKFGIVQHLFTYPLSLIRVRRQVLQEREQARLRAVEATTKAGSKYDFSFLPQYR